MEVMTLDRIRSAIQRTTHLSDRQLWQQYPEFMSLWLRWKCDQDALNMRHEIRERAALALGKACEIPQ